MAGLTTHVLDTVNGRPAAGVKIELFELGPTAGASASRRREPIGTGAPIRR